MKIAGGILGPIFESSRTLGRWGVGRLVVEEAGGWTPPSWPKRSLVGPVARRQRRAAARAADVLESRLGPCLPLFLHSRYHLKISFALIICKKIVSTNEFNIIIFFKSLYQMHSRFTKILSL